MAWLPHYCVLCERRCEGAMDLCTYCTAALPWNTHPCTSCAVPLEGKSLDLCEACAARPPPWQRALAPLLYDGAPARWVQRLKFSNGFREGRVLAHLMADDMLARGLAADLVVPVPLSTWRMMRRGHNQAITLAAALSRALGIPLERRLLIRTRHTQAQADLATSARRRNVAGAFRCRRPIDALHIALVDDVMTTGETLTAASRALQDAGAVSVTLCVATRTPAA